VTARIILDPGVSLLTSGICGNGLVALMLSPVILGLLLRSKKFSWTALY